jgi:hypothetical protein
MTTTAGSRYFSEEFQQAEAKGLAKGRDEGRIEGRDEGQAQGMADAILTVLEGRQVAVPQNVRDRILRCTDQNQLRSWLLSAATATTIDDVTAE